jgi:hypothetical protein
MTTIYEKRPQDLIDGGRAALGRVNNALRAGVQASLQHVLPTALEGTPVDVFLELLADFASFDRSRIPETNLEVLGFTVKGVYQATLELASLDAMVRHSGVKNSRPSDSIVEAQARGCIIGVMALSCVSTAVAASGVALYWLEKHPPPQADPPLTSGSGRTPYPAHSDQLVDVYGAMLRAADDHGIKYKLGGGLPADDERVAALPDDVVRTDFGGLPADFGRDIHKRRAIVSDTAINLIMEVGILARKVLDEGAQVEADPRIVGIQAVFTAAEGFHRPTQTIAQGFRDHGYPEPGVWLDKFAALIGRKEE